MNAPLFPQWTVLFGFIIGAFFGSFLNMVIYRLPRQGVSFSEPKRSFCPKCKHSLEWIDLMPILSWLSTGGKCRYCKEPVSARYLVVEVITGLVFAGIWWQFVAGRPEPDILKAGFYAMAGCALVAIIFIDAELYIIPDELNAFLLVVAVALAALTKPASGAITLVPALEGALLGWGLIWGIQLLGRLLFGKDAMGDGDIKMMRGVGALLGPMLLVANVGIAVVLGIVGGIAGILVAARQAKKAGAEGERQQPEADIGPTPVWIVLFNGLWYLLCLDALALVIRPLDKLLKRVLPPEYTSEEVEDDWEPSATAIPFGPYLAAGALACMLFGGSIQKAMLNYWDNATGAGPGKVQSSSFLRGNGNGTFTEGARWDRFTVGFQCLEKAALYADREEQV